MVSITWRREGGNGMTTTYDGWFSVGVRNGYLSHIKQNNWKNTAPLGIVTHIKLTVCYRAFIIITDEEQARV